jgi:hypothetical protein
VIAAARAANSWTHDSGFVTHIVTQDHYRLVIIWSKYLDISELIDRAPIGDTKYKMGHDERGRLLATAHVNDQPARRLLAARGPERERTNQVVGRGWRRRTAARQHQQGS